VPVAYLESDELEAPAGDGLGEVQRLGLWAADTVGYKKIFMRQSGEKP
jgi:hypothetical protein